MQHNNSVSELRISISACRYLGQPATSINFGPFSGIGMAAGYAESMHGIGLPPLPPSACAAAFSQAGYGGKLICASIDISRFSEVNQVKSTWPYLHHLATLPEVLASYFSPLPLLSQFCRAILHPRSHWSALKTLWSSQMPEDAVMVLTVSLDWRINIKKSLV